MSSTQLLTPSLSEECLLKVCQTLWSWEICSRCLNGAGCLGEACPMQRWKRIFPFLKSYKQLLAVNEGENPSPHGIRQPHHDILDLVKVTKTNPYLTREQLRLHHFGPESQYTDVETANQRRMISLAVKVMTTIGDNLIQQHPWTSTADDLVQRRWEKDESLINYVQNCLKTTEECARHSSTEPNIDFIKIAIRAKKLRKHAGLRFVPTDDVSRHMKIDRGSNSVEIFHSAALLKEHLILTKHLANPTLKECLAIGALPRQLVLEVLDSLQTVIFPNSDGKSREILESLVRAQLFDPDCLKLDFAETRNEEEGHVRYQYLKCRLVALYEETQNPQPQSYLAKWLERKSRARNLVFYTLAGVMTAILIGLISVVLQVFQAYLTWMAWKHPIIQPFESI